MQEKIHYGCKMKEALRKTFRGMRRSCDEGCPCADERLRSLAAGVPAACAPEQKSACGAGFSTDKGRHLWHRPPA